MAEKREKVEYEALDWSDYMPHFRKISDFEEHADTSEFKKNLDAMVDFLGGDSSRYGSRSLAPTEKLIREASVLNSYSLRNLEKNRNIPAQRRAKKGYYTANDLIEMSIAQITYWNKKNLERKRLKAQAKWKKEHPFDSNPWAERPIKIVESETGHETSNVPKSDDKSFPTTLSTGYTKDKMSYPKMHATHLNEAALPKNIIKKDSVIEEFEIELDRKEPDVLNPKRVETLRIIDRISEYEEFKSSKKARIGIEQVSAPTKIPVLVKPELGNQAIASMLSKMPLFAQNVFSIYFLYDGEQTPLYDLGFPSNKFKPFENAINGFGVRLINLEVPQPKNQTYTVKFLDREIKKVASSFEYNHRVDLTFEVDQMASLIQQFQIVSYGNRGVDSNFYFDSDSDFSMSSTLFFPAAFGNRNKKLDVVVLFNNMAKDSEYYTSRQKFLAKDNFFRNGAKQIIGDSESFRAFVFEDVQFLGLNKSLDFSRDGANELKMGTSFRFLKMSEIDNNRVS